MPFTPFHWGPSSWLGLLSYRYINLFAFLIASVIVDIEPFCVMVFNLNYPLHGFFHTYLGGTLAAVVLSIILYQFRGAMNKVAGFFKVSQNTAFKGMLYSCLVGVYFHVFLDSFLYTDIQPFFPLTANPFYGLVSYPLMYLFCGASFVIGGLLYAFKLSTGKIKAVLKSICFLSVTGFIIIMAGLFLLQWTHNPFDDGPFTETPYTQQIDSRPDSTVKLGNQYILEAYNGINDTPVLALRNLNKELLWAKLVTVSNVKNYEKWKVGELHLTRGLPTFGGYLIKGWVKWTFGQEAANFYLDKNGELKKFYLSW